MKDEPDQQEINADFRRENNQWVAFSLIYTGVEGRGYSIPEAFENLITAIKEHIEANSFGEQ